MLRVTDLGSDKGPYDLNEYALLLGKIVGMMMTIETVLRFFLHAEEVKEHPDRTMKEDLNHLYEGQVLPLNIMTSRDTLDALIDQYNGRIRRKDPTLRVSPGLVEIRDAIAHGRTFSPTPSLPLHLFRCSKASGNTVKVETALVLDRAEMNRLIETVGSAYDNVTKAMMTYHPHPDSAT